MALSNGRELLAKVMESEHAIIFQGGDYTPVRLIIHPANDLYKPPAERESDYQKFRADTKRKLEEYETMRETRKNEERHTDSAGLINENYDFDAEGLKNASAGVPVKKSVIEVLTGSTPLSDKVFRLLLDLWMTHDSIGDPLGPRLNEAVTAENLRRYGNRDIVTTYHEFKEE